MAAKRAKRTAKKRSPARKRAKSGRKWSASVMQRSEALDLESGVFKKGSTPASGAVIEALRAEQSPPQVEPFSPQCRCSISRSAARAGTRRPSAAAYRTRRKQYRLNPLPL